MRKATLSLLFAMCSTIGLLYSQEDETSSSDDDPIIEETGDEEIYKLFDVSLEDIMNVGMVSASKKKQSALDAPAYAYVFTQEQIEVRGFQNLLDLIDAIPEVEIQRNSNPEYRNMVTFRGIPGSEKFLILQNGARITPATGDFYTLGQNYSLVNAKRVEVILGPASALYGVDAFSGIINIITVNQDGESFQGGFINTGFGNYGTSNLSFMGATKIDQLKITLSGNVYGSAEPDYNNLYTEDFAWYNNQFAPYGNVVESPFFPTVYELEWFEDNVGSRHEGESLSRNFEMPTNAYNLNAEVSYKGFTAGFYRNSEAHSSAYGVNPKYTTYDKDARMKGSMNLFYMRHNYYSPDRKWNLQSSFEQSLYELDPLSHFASAASRWQRGYVYSFSQSSKVQEQFQVDLSEKWNITAGLSYENLTSLPRIAPTPVPIDKTLPLTAQNIYYIGAGGYTNYSVSDEFADSLTMRQHIYALKYHNFGTYFQGNFSPNRVLDFTFGARFDNNTRFGSTFNPRLGIVVKPGKKLHLKMLIGSAFLAPSPSKTFQQAGAMWDLTADTASADYFRYPNPTLQPEKLISTEISVNYFITKNLSVAFNGFYTDVTNLINPYGSLESFSTPVGFENILATKGETSLNEGYAEFYGFTGKVNYLLTLNKIRINPYFGFAFIDGGYGGYEDYYTVDDSYQLLFYQSNQTWKGGIDFITPRLSISGQFIVKDYSRSNIKEISGLNYDNYFGYKLFNLNFRYKVLDKKSYDAIYFIRFTNLLDNRYYNVYAGNEEGLPTTPQDPIRFLTGLQFKF